MIRTPSSLPGPAPSPQAPTGCPPSLPRRSALLLLAAGLAACAAPAAEPLPDYAGDWDEGYGPMPDGDYVLPHVEKRFTAGINKRALVPYFEPDPPRSIIIDRHAKFLHYPQGDGTSWRYPIAVGRLGLSMRGNSTVRLKREWPGWTPTQNMIRREPEVYAKYAGGVPGGLRSPLGARALYLYRGGKDTYYRIHGTNDLVSIGLESSAGCIRLFNQDIIHLYDQVTIPTEVRLRSLEDSIRIEGYEVAHRGDMMAPTVMDIDTGEARPEI